MVGAGPAAHSMPGPPAVPLCQGPQRGANLSPQASPPGSGAGQQPHGGRQRRSAAREAACHGGELAQPAVCTVRVCACQGLCARAACGAAAAGRPALARHGFSWRWPAQAAAPLAWAAGPCVLRLCLGPKQCRGAYALRGRPSQQARRSSSLPAAVQNTAVASRPGGRRRRRAGKGHAACEPLPAVRPHAAIRAWARRADRPPFHAGRSRSWVGTHAALSKRISLTCFQLDRFALSLRPSAWALAHPLFALLANLAAATTRAAKFV